MIRPLLLTLVITIAGPALAQTTPASGPTPDASVAGTPAGPPPTAAAKQGVTLAQFQARREKAFMAADTDHDGKISLAEWKAFRAKRQAKGDPEKQFARIDTDHDGFIDKRELDAFFAERFARLDKNQDGVLTRDEMPGHKSADNQDQ